MKKYLFPEMDIYELRLSNQILDDESGYIVGDDSDDPFEDDED
jgi:hypothetical protein